MTWKFGDLMRYPKDQDPADPASWVFMFIAPRRYGNTSTTMLWSSGHIGRMTSGKPARCLWRGSMRWCRSMSEFKFGDLICYKGSESKHDAPLAYLNPCGHSHREGGGRGLIDILDLHLRGYGVGRVNIEHKDPAMWQRCRHYESARE